MLNEHPQVELRVADRAFLFYVSDDKKTMKTTFPDGLEIIVTFKIAGYEIEGVTRDGKWRQKNVLQFPITFFETENFLSNNKLSQSHMAFVGHLGVEVMKIYTEHATHTTPTPQANG
jgi:hypothetical protein